MKRVFLLLTLICSLPLMAVLPPLAQSLREIKALAQDPELYSLLGSAEMIENITKTSTGYLITGSSKQVAATISYLPATKGRVGPASFEFTYELVG
ncbi:MAG: hypothetical protein WCN87_03135 [Chlamydiota bacterium]